MKIFRTDNGLAKILFHDHRPDASFDIFTCELESDIFEGHQLGRVTLSSRELLELGKHLTQAGIAKQAGEEELEEELIESVLDPEDWPDDTWMEGTIGDKIVDANIWKDDETGERHIHIYPTRKKAGLTHRTTDTDKCIGTFPAEGGE